MELDHTAYTILIIDDDAPSLKALMDHLQELGFKTLAARNGERGLKVAHRSNPDLILLDVMMPKMDGFETCRRLKENEATKNIPVIFLTALADTTNKIKGFEAGAVDYIAKPIQNREVSVRIRTHLRLRELTEHLEQKVQEQTLELITEIAERKRAEEEVHRRNLELTLLNRIIAASATNPDAETILGIVCQELALALKLFQASATLWNEEKLKATIVAKYRSGEQAAILDQDIPIEDNPIVQYLHANKTPLAVEDAQNDPRLALAHDLLRQRGVVSLLVLPLIIEQEVIGSLNIGAAEPRSFSNEEINLAQRVTEQVAGTLARIQLNEQHRQLEDQLRQSQKMEAIGRLAGGMAHDFNNLLTVITGYSELLLHRHPDKNDSQYKNIEQIYKAGERASVLTRQLLAFSRQQVIEREILDLNAIITDMHKMLRRLVSEDIELITHLDPTLGKIKADRGQIEQIIMNLVVNASDAMPQGGQLTTQTTSVNVDQAYADRHLGLRPGPYIILRISDTGIGMDVETQAQIFEPFFTTKEKGKGTGLGLATVYGIVQQSQGYIEVSSQPEQGTTFQIYLPRSEQDIELADQEQTPTDESQQGTETILLVEDEDLVRELARYTLLQDGYNVLEAGHGQEALKFCEQYSDPIHLLLTDVVMPGGLSGHDLAEQLALKNPNLKVLYMSGYVDETIAQRGMTLNSDVAFLQKPFSPIDLSHKVREVLDTQVGPTTYELGG
jgi:DNA-binding response OmpR family regulator/nitrogen-specific signal transduction histidine kinase